ncbi:helix-turn-helix transcriptional regulator [Paenibacillaceae bacterium WGS1546]|uniref:helix-turn-helix transcriptional regulator n=1 Tax=Cohnella sp. WGS1546 TaxID=3366810 RepID=UPI00372D77E2
MSKSKRLMELMMTVNRMRKFTVKELAAEFNVSSRTILRDLQELGELGVPLYSEVGPHGGYRILQERILPPIAFREQEAVAMFFASHALRHYLSLPFEAESSAALRKFYTCLPGDVKDRIDQMRNRVDFHACDRRQTVPFLGLLLDAAVRQQVVTVRYAGKSGASERLIQPVGIYASNGFWYCPAYCFLREDFRLFRCDRMQSAAEDASGMKPLDHRHIHLGNWRQFEASRTAVVRMVAELSREGVHRCEADLWPVPHIGVREDGSGRLDQLVPATEIPYFAAYFLGLGREAEVLGPQTLVQEIRDLLAGLTAKYARSGERCDSEDEAR